MTFYFNLFRKLLTGSVKYDAIKTEGLQGATKEEIIKQLKEFAFLSDTSCTDSKLQTSLRFCIILLKVYSHSITIY